ncbi:MAG: hypothetical protein HQM08_05260 [Candidatus Riflebacteria bacterium]|nr:hypothetical protein [Candidatus Riflebacteria bacterium]
MDFRFSLEGKFLSIQRSISDFELSEILLIVLNPVMASALSLQKIPILHGSALVIDDRAVIFAGKSGVGKSTLSAVLAQEGMALLSDDLIALNICETGVEVQPGYPRLKVSLETADFLGKSPQDLIPIARWAPNERWLDSNVFPKGFCSTKTTLSTIYILEGIRKDISAPEIAELPVLSACYELSKYRYGKKWLEIENHAVLQICASIASHVVIKRVWLPDGLEKLKITAKAIILDVQNIAKKQAQ